MLIISVKLGKD